MKEKIYYTFTDGFYINEVNVIEKKFFGIKRYIIKYPCNKIVRTFSNPIGVKVFETEEQAIRSFLKKLDQELRELSEFRNEQEMELEKTEEMMNVIKDIIVHFERKINNER